MKDQDNDWTTLQQQADNDEAKYSINFTASKTKFCLSLPCNGRNSFLYVDGVKVYQFKVKDSEIKPYCLCLGSISKDFTVDNIKKLD